MRKLVIPAGKRVSSAMDGRLKSIHGAWIPAIHAGMTILNCVFMKSDKVELSAFLIAMGGALGTLFKGGDTGALFWMCVFFMILFIIAGFAVITKIKQKTKEIGSYDGYFCNVSNRYRHFCDVFIFD